MTMPHSLGTLARPAVRLLREMPVYGHLAGQRGRGPLAVFLPACAPEGAALLRIYALARALRPLGWGTLVMPWRLTLAQRRRVLAAAGADVIVMQGARHGLNRPGLYGGCPVVYDMDDADFHLDHLAAPVTEAMGHVSGVIAGSAYIADWCRAAGVPRADVVWTGTRVSPGARVPQADRPAVVAWAQTAPSAYGAEAAFVREVMARLSVRCPEVRLRLYDRRPGDDPAFLDGFRAAGIRVEWRETACYRDYLASFDDVAAGLAPLCPEAPFVRGKSFGKVLGYLDRHVPVIASDACEHAAFFDAGTAVVSNDAGVWVAALERLLGDAGARQRMAEAAFARFETRLSIDEAARRVDGILRGYIT
jgi:hypothetical protein